jgi:plasmid maintenance system antidote protein VapI
MPMKNPLHPGGFVLRQCIEPLGVTITQAAAAPMIYGGFD